MTTAYLKYVHGALEIHDRRTLYEDYEHYVLFASPVENLLSVGFRKEKKYQPTHLLYKHMATSSNVNLDFRLSLDTHFTKLLSA